MKPTPALPIRALVVDDDPMLLELLAAFLESRGYEVARGVDGVDALERLGTGDFNLVVTDRHMPRMDGLALCRAIRARPALGYTYCIMLTAAFDEQSLVAAMDAGVDDFVGKPLKPAELGARLRAAERVLELEAQMAARNQQLSQAYAQLSRDLELARALQLGQLPPPRSFGCARLHGMYEASSYVGGDIYDYFPLPGDRLAFYLADVSGHGVAAAMMAVHVQHELRELSRALSDTGVDTADLGATAVAIVQAYNRRVLQMEQSGMYVTLAFGLLDCAGRRAALVHAGHPLALHSPAAAAGFAAVGAGDVPVGILPDPRYEARIVAMPPGSRLALYSDGVTECSDGTGQPFGEQRLTELLQRRRGEAPDAGCAALRDALRGWRGAAFEDDVTLLLLESV